MPINNNTTNIIITLVGIWNGFWLVVAPIFVEFFELALVEFIELALLEFIDFEDIKSPLGKLVLSTLIEVFRKEAVDTEPLLLLFVELFIYFFGPKLLLSTLFCNFYNKWCFVEIAFTLLCLSLRKFLFNMKCLCYYFKLKP